MSRTVVVATRHLLDVLMQRATERDIEFLEAATDTEHRHATLDRALQQRQGRSVTMFILQDTFTWSRSAIVLGRDI